MTGDACYTVAIKTNKTDTRKSRTDEIVSAENLFFFFSSFFFFLTYNYFLCGVTNVQSDSRVQLITLKTCVRAGYIMLRLYVRRMLFVHYDCIYGWILLGYIVNHACIFIIIIIILISPGTFLKIFFHALRFRLDGSAT